MKNAAQIKSITLTALMIAIVYVGGSIIKIPTFGGFVHIGDSMVLLSAVILGSKKGAVASGAGMLLVDVLGGYMVWAPFTLAIKFLMAFIAGTILMSKSNTQVVNVKSCLIAFIPACVFMIAAYFVAGAVIAAFLSDSQIDLAAGFAFAAKDIPGNIAQSAAGIIIALPLSLTLARFKL